MYYIYYFSMFCITLLCQAEAVLIEYGNYTSYTRRDPASNQLLQFKASKNLADVNDITTKFGTPISRKIGVETIGPYGPILLQDFQFIDEMTAFDRERIAERVVHAKGAGAFGYFETTHDIYEYCSAKIFSNVGKRTPVAVRFSTVIGESGSADTLRDPRGFAIKFYTEEGNWDIVGLNSPVFFIREPMLFPSLIHALKRNPVTHLFDADMRWDFLTLRPESIRQVLNLFSDSGMPDGYRHMDGFGIHAFKFINKQGEFHWVKFHLKTNQGLRNLTVARAFELAASDPDYSIRDLYNAIATKNYPTWDFFIQIMTPNDAKNVSFNAFDATKEWPLSDFPLFPVGKLVLNKNPLNNFHDVEQMAFDPANLVPGIEPSHDKILQGRLFSYTDTQRHRLGANFLQLHVNIPHNTEVHNYQRDGPFSVENNNQGGSPNYFPNSFHGPMESIAVHSKPSYFSGDVQRYDTGDEDNFAQAIDFYLNMNEDAKDRLARNIAQDLRKAVDFIQNRAISLLSKVDINLAAKVTDNL